MYFVPVLEISRERHCYRLTPRDMINATANMIDDIKKTSVKSFADSAYSICFVSLFEFRLVHPKIKFSSTCFGEYKI